MPRKKRSTKIIKHDKAPCVERLSLIAAVKRHPMLYNKQLPEYANASFKDKNRVWELIPPILFPNYEELSQEIKDVIKKTVRKRWTRLRDALVQDHRFRDEDPDLYKYKKMSRTIKAMQFLVPHLKYPYPRRKIAKKDINGKHSPSPSPDGKLKDERAFALTSDEEVAENSHSQTDDDEMSTNEILNPSVHLTTLKTECEEVDGKDGCYVAAGDVATKRSIQEVEETETSKETRNPTKRRATDSIEDLNSNFNDLINRFREDSQDEDRMFLLSLLSDLKRVPINKKLKIKSAFVTALYKTLECVNGKDV